MICTHLNTHPAFANLARVAFAIAALGTLPACGGGWAGSSDGVSLAEMQTQTQAAPSLNAAPSCDWLRTADSLALELSYDTAPATSHAAASGQLRGKLLRLPSPPNGPHDGTRFGTWLSDWASLQDPGAARGNVSDNTRGAPGNAFALRVDFETCTYTLGASVQVAGASTAWGGELAHSQQPWRRVATFAATDLPLLQAGEITAALPAQAVRDVNENAAGQARWVPAGPQDAWRIAGPAQLRWHLVLATTATRMQ
jgi:hypothetical protein